MTEPFNIILRFFLVGRMFDDLNGARNPNPVFCSCWVELLLRYTSDGKMSIGHNNMFKHISIDSHMLHYKKESIKKVVETQRMKTDDCHEINVELSGIRLTNATVNNIFKRLGIYKAWIHKDWELKNPYTVPHEKIIPIQ